MDTSEQYIKMCEKAEEIQALKKRVAKPSGHGWSYIENYTDWDGDYVLDCNAVELHCAGCNTEYGGRGLTSNAIWLPRQDQLQEMVRKVREGSYVLSARFDREMESFITNLSWSMEQLWLAFMMKEKYNKVWDSKDWV